MCVSFADSPDCAACGCSVPDLLAPTPHHHHVGRVWAVPLEQYLLHLPHHLSLLSLRELLHQPHYLRFPVREFPQSLPASFHLQKYPADPSSRPGQDPHGELFHHSLDNECVKWNWKLNCHWKEQKEEVAQRNTVRELHHPVQTNQSGQLINRVHGGDMTASLWLSMHLCMPCLIVA